MKILAVISALAVVSAAFPAASHAASDEPITVIPTFMGNHGTGCPASDEHKTTMDVKGHTWTFTLPHQQMITSAGANTPKAENHKSCQFAIHGKVPAGYSYGIKQLTLTGSAYIERGARADMLATTYFLGGTANQVGRAFFPGPFTNTLSVTMESASEDIVWAPCGVQRNLILDLATAVESGTQTADSLSWLRQDEPQSVTVEVVTRQCT